MRKRKQVARRAYGRDNATHTHYYTSDLGVRHRITWSKKRARVLRKIMAHAEAVARRKGTGYVWSSTSK